MSIDPDLLERVQTRLSLVPGPPTPARVAAALRDEGGAGLGDLGVLNVLRAIQQQNAKSTERVGYYHRHPTYIVPPVQPLMREVTDADPKVTEHLSMVLGSDLILSVQMVEYRRQGRDTAEFVFYLFDSDGNSLTDDGFARCKAYAPTYMHMLPSVVEMARIMYPNHLLMAVDAR